MITGLQVKIYDKNSEYFGVPTINLMENAGKDVSDFIKNNLKLKNKQILVLCGPGNNGGDGFVAARHLSKYNKVTVFIITKEIKTNIARKNFERLKKENAAIFSEISKLNNILLNSDIIIDSLLGVGLSGRLRDPYASIVNMTNSLKNKIIISVDIPTGFQTQTSIKPNYTITFHDIKEKMNKSNCGEIHIVDIGIPKEAVEYVGPGELSAYYPRPKKDSHKGENGIVLVIGGGPYVGAPALSGLAALRTGADLSIIATPARCFQSVASYSPNLIVKDLSFEHLVPEDISIIKNYISRSNCVIIGPGLGDNTYTEHAIVNIIKDTISKKIPLVIDADAIKPVGENISIIKNSRTVITPHAGEFKKLTKIKLTDDLHDRIKNVKDFAGKNKITILLKGPIDIISNGVETKLNKIHNEAMTVGGTGDVLTGIIGALLSKSLDPIKSCMLAAFINGQAGNFAFEKKSYGLVATDVIEEIPSVLIKYL